MKKALLLGLIAAALAPAYSATSWLLGRQLEAALDEQYRQMKEQPYIRLVRREYDRGVYSSTELVTFQLLDRFPQALGSTWSPSADEMQTPEVFGADPAEHRPLRFTLRSEIRHGPLPGLAAIAAAVAESEFELELDGPAAAQLTQALGGARPLTIRTAFRFDGGGTSTLASPAFSARFATGEGAPELLVSSGGLDAELEFAEGMKRYRFSGGMPRLVLQEGDGNRLVVADVKFDGNQARVFDDEPLLLGGTQNLSVGEISLGDGRPGGSELLVKGLAYRADVPVAGDFVDIGGKLSADVVQVGAEQYGPAHYELSLRHVHARTAARLYRALARLYVNAAQPTADADLLAGLAEPALALLNHGAQLSLDRLSFTSAQGEARIEGRARLSEAAPALGHDPTMLLSRLEVAAELGFPEALLTSLPRTLAQTDTADHGPAPSDAAEIAARSERWRRQIERLADRGYVDRADGRIHSRLELKNGSLSVNGKPFKTVAGVHAGAPAVLHPMQ